MKSMANKKWYNFSHVIQEVIQEVTQEMMQEVEQAYVLGVVEVQTPAKEVLHVGVSVPVVDVPIFVFKDPLCLPSLLLQQLHKARVSDGLRIDIREST